ncbi:FAS1-like dehydratase domain-containing protein [Tropicimonas isoalkanivorans]|uniref:N-terminal half of MaoC dehydratase n=1 Tax=Tropicimonas isoalkanivorans TaxID=441112 RepID=A0A1I1I4W4_9RHOB|nr:MaoC family dehydratase N-terminal domain-containing protein [Tropicimonas isoalkanivorans]SFC28733.1 N-terminal half of MaoC dehydratase [Tropicimonas isoalkanivorans]
MTGMTIESFARDLETRFGHKFVETIESGRVRDYLAALDATAPDADRPEPGTPVPPLFLLTLARQRRPHLAQSTGGGGVNAGDTFRFLAEARVGDRITVTCTVTEIVEKTGKRDMLRATVHFDYVNQHGTKIAERDNTLMRWATA